MTTYRLERHETVVEPDETESGESTFEQLARLEGALIRLTRAGFAEHRRRALEHRRRLHGLLAALA